MRSKTTSLSALAIACCLSQFIHTVYGSVVNIALPAISKDLHVGMDALQWAVSAYVLALASLLTFAGTLADRFGRRRVLVVGNVVMIVGAVVCALSGSMDGLIVGRVLQGVGSAMIAPAGLSLLTGAVGNTPRRAIAVMWWTTIGTFSLAAGPILGGVLVRHLGWQSVFWAGVPLGVVAIVLALALLPESRSATASPFDPAGLALLTVFLSALTFTLIEGVHLGWSSSAILIAIVVAGGSLIALVWVERRQQHPVLPLELLSDRSFTTALLTAVLGYLALAGLLFLNTFYLQSERGLDAMSAGLLTIPLALGATASALAAPRFVMRGRSRLALLLAGSLIAAGAGALWATEDAGLWWIMAPYLVFGLGVGLIADPVSVTALESLPMEKAGLASSLISTSKQVGQMLGIAGVGTVLAAAAAGSESAAFVEMGAWAWAILVAAGVAIVALTALSRPAQGARVRRSAV